MPKTAFSGTQTCSAIPPGRVTPTPFQLSQKFCRLERHAGQLLHAMFGSTATLSPGRKRLTSAPTADTVPANSCPGVMGYVPRYSPR